MVIRICISPVSAILHPQCVKKAQAELDTVIGRSRMPTFDDESSLPYVQAMIKESLRWRVVAPIGLAHATTEDDVYMGYKIPKGSTVWGNIKCVLLAFRVLTDLCCCPLANAHPLDSTISQDLELFANPETFEPERFLNAKDPRLVDFNLPFGFGRRICPGQAVAMQSLFIVISRYVPSGSFSRHMRCLPNRTR